MRVSFLGFGTISNTIIETVRACRGETDIRFDSFFDPFRKPGSDYGLKRLEHFEELFDNDSETIIEASSHEGVREYVPRLLEAGKKVVSMSVGAYLDPVLYTRIKEICRNPDSGKLYMPSGALPSADVIRAASLMNIERAELITRKPPSALDDAPGFSDKKYKNLKRAETIFRGTAAEAVKLFPKNINIAATLSLLGIGPDRTEVTVIADPEISLNIHKIRISGDFGSLESEICNKPSGNLKTSRIAALSAASLLLKINGKISIGS